MRIFFVRFLVLLALSLGANHANAAIGRAAKDYASAKQLAQKGETAKSLLILNRLSDSLSAVLKSHADSLLLIDVYTLNGQNYRTLGDMEKSLSLYREALSLAQTMRDKQRYANLCNSIFAIYYSARRFSTALDLLKKSLQVNLQLGDSANIRNVYNNFGLVAYEQRQYNKALQYMDKALSYTPENDLIGQSLVFTNRAEVFVSQGKYGEAETELHKSIRLQQSLPFDERTMQTSLNMAYVKAKLGKRHDADAIVRRIKDSIRFTPLTAQSHAYRQLTDISFLLGDSIGALRHILKYEELGDSVWRDDRDAQLRQLLVAYDTERLRHSNDTLSASVDAYRTIVGQRTVIACVIAAFLIVLAALLVVLWLRMKSDRQKNLLINSQNARLLAYEQQEHERKQREMTQQLDNKNRQLTTYTIDLAAINEFHQRLGAELVALRDRLGNDIGSDSVRLNEIINSVRHYNDKPVDEDFRVYFDEVHPDFLRNLSKLYPQLSKMDLRLCAYLHLGMSTKEISALTYREVRSVESSRYRLRKKLNVPPDVSMSEFFSSLQT